MLRSLYGAVLSTSHCLNAKSLKRANAAPIPRLGARPTAVFTFSEYSDDFALYRPLCPSCPGRQQATAAVLVVFVGCPTRPDVSSDFFARAS